MTKPADASSTSGKHAHREEHVQLLVVGAGPSRARQFRSGGQNCHMPRFPRRMAGQPAGLRFGAACERQQHWGRVPESGGHANLLRTAEACAWAIEDLRGRILQHRTVTRFERSSGGVSGVVTDRGTFGCDSVVMACGPQTAMLSGWLGASVPTVNARAEMIVAEPLELMPFGGVDDNGLYCRQALRGNLAYGGGPHDRLADGAQGEARDG